MDGAAGFSLLSGWCWGLIWRQAGGRELSPIFLRFLWKRYEGSCYTVELVGLKVLLLREGPKGSTNPKASFLIGLEKVNHYSNFGLGMVVLHCTGWWGLQVDSGDGHGKNEAWRWRALTGRCCKANIKQLEGGGGDC